MARDALYEFTGVDHLSSVCRVCNNISADPELGTKVHVYLPFISKNPAAEGNKMGIHVIRDIYLDQRLVPVCLSEWTHENLFRYSRVSFLVSFRQRRDGVDTLRNVLLLAAPDHAYPIHLPDCAQSAP